MKYDTVVIGGGNAGLTCALRCLQAGHKTALIASGQSASHFSSGSIDVLAKTPDGKIVTNPLAAIERFANDYPRHPYAVLGKETVSHALAWYQKTLSAIGVPLIKQDSEENHYRLTPLGTLKSTWLSQSFVQQFPMRIKNTSVKKIVLLTIDGFRDFQPKLALDNLKKLNLFSDVEVSSAVIPLSIFSDVKRNHCELRSIDLSRLLAKSGVRAEFISLLKQNANPGDLVVLPALFGDKSAFKYLKEVEQFTGLTLCEVPTMPPSLMGIRLEVALKQAFIDQGGVFLAGDHVTHGEFTYIEKEVFEDSYYHLDRIFTVNHGDFPLQAKHFLLATGSFFSKGLKANFNSMEEPVFGLDLKQSPSRVGWFNKDFFNPKSHPFLNMGVKVNRNFQALKSNQVIENLYCAGAVLSGYNPINEGCGSGVAISTGFHAAESIIKQQILNKEALNKEMKEQEVAK